MANYAIVEIAGKQYKAQEGSELIVDKLKQDTGEITFDKVLLLSLDGQVKVGNPYVSGVSVTAKVLGAEKDEKIYVVKFKAKARYKKRIGFRAQQTRLKIESIGTSCAKEPVKIKTKTTKSTTK